MSLFTGAGVAIITQMNEDGSVNYAKLAELIESSATDTAWHLHRCNLLPECPRPRFPRKMEWKPWRRKGERILPW